MSFFWDALIPPMRESIDFFSRHVLLPASIVSLPIVQLIDFKRVQVILFSVYKYKAKLLGIMFGR